MAEEQVDETKKRLFLSKVDKYLEDLANQMGMTFFEEDPYVERFHEMVLTMLAYRGMNIDECIEADPKKFAKIMYMLEPTSEELVSLGFVTPEEVKQAEKVAEEFTQKIAEASKAQEEDRLRKELAAKNTDRLLTYLVENAHILTGGVLN